MSKNTLGRRRRVCRFALGGLLLLLAACAGNGGPQGSDNDGNHGFYGGISGGWTQP